MNQQPEARVVLRCASLCVMALTLSAAPAVAQTQESPASITAFAGVAMASGPHPATGVAVGLKLLPGPVSLEFEHSRGRRDPTAGVPAMETFAINILTQPSRQRSRFQFYGTFGVGLYAVLRDNHVSDVTEARNIGGGVKVTLAGPLKFRMDYRAFFLGKMDGEDYPNAHRFFVGIVAGF